ncbi:DUF6266 family protein [Paradesertivirga mongoliensis]|uniref:DUF6266 family protein n=1 Tax=Paradesertivirga mongoliensis TaxID=2100740 RepID=A0ABW4ZQ69_9SPHI|nr:DUF6266 family protein [Pedobacter mongoliensis]
MGIIRNGANGGFSGKAGSVVGSSWKDVDYIKGLPRKSSKAPTQLQLEQQAKFALAIQTLQPITALLNDGFKGSKTTRASGYNLAMQHLLNNAITGIYPNYTVDYTKMKISKGSLIKPSDIVMLVDAGVLQLSWSVLVSKYGAFADDELTVLIYNPVKNIYLPAEGALRADGALDVPLPGDFTGDTVHVFMFFSSRDLTKQSESTYAGSILVV